MRPKKWPTHQSNTRLTPVDLASEAWRSISRNFGRSLVTAIGTLLGSVAFVATLGITGTLGQQVSDAFDLRRSTTVTVAGAETQRQTASEEGRPRWLSTSSLARAQDIAGIIHAGPRAKIEQVQIDRSPLGSATLKQSRMIGASEEALKAMGPHLADGRLFDAGHADRSDRVVLLSNGLAQALSVTRVNVGVTIDTEVFTVIGIYNDIDRDAEAMAGFIVPLQTLERLFPFTVAKYDLIAETSPGAALQAGSQLDEALQPEDPSQLSVIAPPDPQTLRREIEGNVTQLSLLASVVALVVGAVSIGNAATASMVLRTSEIGLRRAMGARRIDIFVQLLGETTALGGVGGAAGALLGIITTVVVSLANQWAPILDLKVAAIAILTGCVAGAIAGIGPAFRATKISPAAALTQ